jgi:ankyrin repeat protein
VAPKRREYPVAVQYPKAFNIGNVSWDDSGKGVAMTTGKCVVVLLASFAGLVLTGCATVAKVQTPPEKVQALPELESAIRDGNLNKVKAIVEENPELVNSTCDLQVERYLYDIVVHQLKKVSPQIIEGTTPLYNAVWYNNKDMVNLLLERGAEVNTQVKGKEGIVENPWCHSRETPFLLAVREGRKEVLPLLIANGAKLDARNEHGDTPLDCVVGYSYYDTTDGLFKKSPNAQETAVLLIKNGADVKTVSKSGQTLLHYAARNGWCELAAILIEKGADVNAGDRNGRTPLDWAIWSNNKEVIDLLKKHGAGRNKEVIDMLKKYGAATNPKSTTLSY